MTPARSFIVGLGAFLATSLAILVDAGLAGNGPLA